MKICYIDGIERTCIIHIIMEFDTVKPLGKGYRSITIITDIVPFVDEDFPINIEAYSLMVYNMKIILTAFRHMDGTIPLYL